MPRPTPWPAIRTAAAVLLGIALLAPAAALAAEPSADGSASTAPSAAAPGASATGVVVVDPSFIAEPTARPSGAVLAATGRPVTTPPATDVSAAERVPTGGAPALPLVLAALATISIGIARMPGARRR